MQSEEKEKQLEKQKKNTTCTKQEPETKQNKIYSDQHDNLEQDKEKQRNREQGKHHSSAKQIKKEKKTTTNKNKEYRTEEQVDSSDTNISDRINQYRTQKAIEAKNKDQIRRQAEQSSPTIDHDKMTRVKKPYDWGDGDSDDSSANEEEAHYHFMDKYVFNRPPQGRDSFKPKNNKEMKRTGNKQTGKTTTQRIQQDCSQDTSSKSIHTPNERAVRKKTSTEQEKKNYEKMRSKKPRMIEEYEQDTDCESAPSVREQTSATNDSPMAPKRSKEIKKKEEGTKVEIVIDPAVAAWREIFRKYRIRSIKQANETTIRPTQQVQPILFRQSDNEEVGDSFIPAEDGTFRIYYQNVNGVSASKGKSKWNDINDIMAKQKVSIFGLSKTNIEWNKNQTKGIMKAILRKHFAHAILETSTTRMKFEEDYKPGGTCTAITNNWTGRFLQSIEDNTGQGRWSGIIIRGHWFNVAIITAYRVTQRAIEQAGPTTAYAQQWAVSRLQGTEKPEPRKQFIQDIKRLLKQLKKDGNKIILMMDANEAIGKDNNGVSTIASDCNLIDVHTSRHQEAAATATYARGTNKIDYIFVTPELLPLVTRSGMLPFYSGIHTDHRGMYLDIDARALFNGKIAELYSQPTRILSSKMPKAVLVYKQELLKQLKAHNIPRRSEEIQKRSKQGDTTIAEELNRIANTIQEAMLSAEQHCKKPPAHPYSEKLAALNKIIRFWKTIKSHMTTGRNVENIIDSIKEKIPKPMQHLLIKKHAVNTHIQKAVDSYQRAVPNAIELRQEQIRQWAEAAAKRGKKTMAQHFKAMANAEHTRNTFRILKNVIKPQDRSGITRLKVPTTDGNGNQTYDAEKIEQWHTLTDPKDIEHTIIERNITHFGQATDTPFNSTQFTEIFGIDGDSEATEDLLRGIMPDISNLPIEVQLILKKISQDPQPAIDPSISVEDLKNLFKNWKESTSTSPSGCHLGHWHALLAPDGTRPNPDSSEDSTEDQIMQIHANILNTAVTSGIPLERWTKVTSSMISKLDGQARIDKLRVIHGYEADYNGLLKIEWPQRAVKNATKTEVLNYSQGGGQKGRQASHIVLQKEMKYMYARLRKHNMATMDNDAKACYDRIIMSLATIVSGYYGLPRNIRKLQAKAIRAMQFHIKTALGVSEDYYTDTPTTPLHGSGQGSGSASTLWLFISSIIMTIYQDLATGMKMTNAEITEKLHEWIDGYVDDTSIFTSIEEISEVPNAVTIAEQLQKDASIWEKLLSATGGKLELTKCFYYILQWKFDEEGVPSHTSKQELEENGVKIAIQEIGKDQPTEIKHLDCDEAHRTLGIYKTITGNQQEQKKQTSQKSETISRAVGASHFTRKQAKTAWNAIYIPGVTYPSVATYLKQKELEKIENRAITVFLPKMGYNRTTARAVVYGPAEHGGIGIKNLYAEQSIAQITALIQHTRLQSPLGRTIRINLDWVQIIAGIGLPVLEDTRPIKHIEGEWFMAIREFLHKTNCDVKIDGIWTPTVQRQKDQCIMDALRDCTDIVRVNRVRIYLQATTIADIANAEGTHITEYSFGGRNSRSTENPRRSTHQWPRQPRPGPKSWKVWKNALQQVLSIDGKSRKLRQSLGKWTLPQKCTKQEWNWYFDPDKGNLIERRENGFQIHQATEHPRQFESKPSTTIQSLPTDAVPVTTKDFRIASIPEKYDCTNTVTENNVPTTFEDYVDKLDTWERNLLQTTGNVRDTKDVTERIVSSEKTYMVSDGGMINGYGSYGWIIANDDELTRGRGEAEGAEELMQSFRAEGYGMLAVLRYIHHAFTFTGNWPTSNKIIHMYCDNLALIQRIGWHEKRIVTTPKDVIRADYDLEAAIKDTIDALRTKKIFIKEKHVSGHQDKHAEYENLNQEEQMNVQADREATKALKEHLRQGEYSQMPTTRSMLYHNGRPITSKEAETLRQVYGQIAYSEHVTKKEQWKPATYATVWWEVQKRSLSKLEDNDRTRITKFVNKILPSNSKLHQQDKQHSSKCPSCNEIETNHHISACSNPRRTQQRNNMFQTVKKAMEKTSTHIQAQEIIMHGLKAAVTQGIEKVDNTELSFEPSGIIKLALQEQNNIGWTNFYKGRMSKKWEQVQQQHYKKTKPKKTDTHRWATSIILAMWQGLLLIWEDRNNDQHGRDTNEKFGKEREKLLQKIDQLYTQKESIDPEDRRLYHKPVENWNEETNKKMREWINLAEPLTRPTTKTGKRRKVDKRQPSIGSFFVARRQEEVPKNTRTYTRRPPRKNQDEE